MEHIRYKVVVNHEEQYALWMHHKENASGWKDTGVTGTKSECLEYIRQVWTDMRPLSLRQAMEDANDSSPVYDKASLHHAAQHNRLAAYFE